jgi:phosphoglycolate phosphatase
MDPEIIHGERKMTERKNISLAFDMDGTIYDSAAIVVEAFRDGIMEAAAKIGRGDMPVPTRDQILSLVGLPAFEIYRRFFPQLEQGDLVTVSEACNASFVRLISAGGGALMEGAEKALRDFHHRGYRLLMASNGRSEYIEAILKTHGIAGYFDRPMHFVGEDIPDKSDILALYKQRLSPGELLIMVGDRESDRMAAANNGVPFIGCAFGHVGDAEIRGERWIVHSFSEIPGAVREIEEEYGR